ncbi:MAG: peptide deformylase [Ruminococcus sp.]|nr:peptide deformylase [Ruminococcus sp.]
MVKTIVKDVLFLGQKSEPATKDDINIIKDLQDTLAAHRNECVGMAANMIGYKKQIIIVDMGFMDMIMINPVIIKKSAPYEAEEGCLSLNGTRKTTRYSRITVEFLNTEFKKQRKEFNAYFAEIIQHEIDHCNGIII